MIYLIGYIIGFVSALLISRDNFKDGIAYIIGFAIGAFTFFILHL